jgi:hypothetical protein
VLGYVLIDPKGADRLRVNEERRGQQLDIDEAAVLARPARNGLHLILQQCASAVGDRRPVEILGLCDEVVEVLAYRFFGRVAE